MHGCNISDEVVSPWMVSRTINLCDNGCPYLFGNMNNGGDNCWWGLLAIESGRWNIVSMNSTSSNSNVANTINPQYRDPDIRYKNRYNSSSIVFSIVILKYVHNVM